MDCDQVTSADYLDDEFVNKLASDDDAFVDDISDDDAASDNSDSASMTHYLVADLMMQKMIVQTKIIS